MGKQKKSKKPKVRKSWGDLDPTTKIIPDKKTNYNRTQAKQDFLEALDEEMDWLDIDEDEF